MLIVSEKDESNMDELSSRPRNTVSEIPESEKTILVLDSDSIACSFTVAMLQGPCYRVYEAGDAGTTDKVLLEDGVNIDLLLSEIAVPGGGTGPEAADGARDTHPNLRFIRMSDDDVVLGSGATVSG